VHSIHTKPSIRSNEAEPMYITGKIQHTDVACICNKQISHPTSNYNQYNFVDKSFFIDARFHVRLCFGTACHFEVTAHLLSRMWSAISTRQWQHLRQIWALKFLLFFSNGHDTERWTDEQVDRQLRCIIWPPVWKDAQQV